MIPTKLLKRTIMLCFYSTRTYVSITFDSKPFPHICEFTIKYITGSEPRVYYRAGFCISRNKYWAFQVVDSKHIYSFVVSHETIPLLFANSCAQNLILQGAGIYDTNLYRNIERDVYIEQPCDSTKTSAYPEHIFKQRK